MSPACTLLDDCLSYSMLMLSRRGSRSITGAGDRGGQEGDPVRDCMVRPHGRHPGLEEAAEAVVRPPNGRPGL